MLLVKVVPASVLRSSNPLMKAELQKLADMKPISNDLFEVVSRGLK